MQPRHRMDPRSFFGARTGVLLCMIAATVFLVSDLAADGRPDTGRNETVADEAAARDVIIAVAIDTGIVNGVPLAGRGDFSPETMRWNYENVRYGHCTPDISSMHANTKKMFPDRFNVLHRMKFRGPTTARSADDLTDVSLVTPVCLLQAKDVQVVDILPSSRNIEYVPMARPSDAEYESLFGVAVQSNDYFDAVSLICGAFEADLVDLASEGGKQSILLSPSGW